MSSTPNLIKDQAISLLTQGLSTSQVAAACGVSDSYISQLRSDPETAAVLASAGVELTIADLQFDKRLESAESMALERIEKSIGFANMGQALSAFRILNTARKRQDSLAGAQSPGITVNVNLTLPAVASARYVTNSANEIVEVEGKTMISATAKSLDAILLARSGGNNSVPALTSLEKAATMLDNMRPPIYRAPRRLPTELSADIL